MSPENPSGRDPCEDAARRDYVSAGTAVLSPPLPTSQETSGKKLIAAFARLDRRSDRRRKPRRFLPIGNSFSIVRLREVERFLTWRYGCTLHDDDAGRDDLQLLLACAKLAGKPVIDYCRKWAPWMTPSQMGRAITRASVYEATVKADVITTRLGVTYTVRQSLRMRTIGAIDVNKAGRDRMRRGRAEAKRQARAAAQREAKARILSPREKVILKMVGTGIRMGDLARKAERHRLFQGREDTPRQVRRIVNKLEKAGHVGSHLERSGRGGKERYVRRDSREVPCFPANPEVVRREPLVSQTQIAGQKNASIDLRSVRRSATSTPRASPSDVIAWQATSTTSVPEDGPSTPPARAGLSHGR